MAINNIKNHRNACRYFWPELDGKNPKGIVLHHKDPSLKDNDPERYDEWRPEDLVPMKREEHARLHLTIRMNDPLEKSRWVDHVKEVKESTRILLSEISKKAWSNPEYVKRQIEIQKIVQNTPEALESKSKHAKQRWSNPDNRKRQAELMNQLKWFTNKITGKHTRAKESPGPDWVLGRTYHKKLEIV